MHRAAARDQEAGAGAASRQQSEPEQPRPRAARDGDDDGADGDPVETAEAARRGLHARLDPGGAARAPPRAG
jgi:hypothetical protein